MENKVPYITDDIRRAVLREPIEVISVDEILKSAREIEINTYIYFLICQEQVVYVGQTRTPQYRIQTHLRSKKEFDGWSIAKCNHPWPSDVEATYIVELEPQYNAVLPANRIWTTKARLCAELKKYGKNKHVFNRYVKSSLVKTYHGYYKIVDFVDMFRECA
jgi:hypothetical protein